MADFQFVLIRLLALNRIFLGGALFLSRIIIGLRHTVFRTYSCVVANATCIRTYSNVLDAVARFEARPEEA